MNELILSQLYKALSDVLILILIPAIISAAIALIKNELAKGKLIKNAQVNEAVTTAVHAVEQLYQSGKLKGLEKASADKFDEALDIAQMLLDQNGVKVEVHELGSRIEAKVFAEITSQVVPFLAETITSPLMEAPVAPKAE